MLRQAQGKESNNLVSDIRFKHLHFPLVENTDLTQHYESINVQEEEEYSDSWSRDTTFTFAHR